MYKSFWSLFHSNIQKSIESSSKYKTIIFIFIEIQICIYLKKKYSHSYAYDIPYISHLQHKISSPFNAWQNSNSLRRVLISCRVGERCWFRFSCWILLLFFLIFRFPLLKKTDFDFHQKIKKEAKNTEHISGKTCLANVHAINCWRRFAYNINTFVHPNWIKCILFNNLCFKIFPFAYLHTCNNFYRWIDMPQNDGIS